ncbi:MAG: hypothetical protein LUE87_09920 [Lachnospiraceae bacterium]|nr:hypothetical protein [Lachnospiraceae bacterium]
MSEGHSSGIPTIQEELERNGSPRAEFFTDEDRRAMRIRIPIHPAFLGDESEKTKGTGDNIKSITPKTEEQYATILNFMADRQWHKTSEIKALLSLKETRTKQLMKELVSANKLVDNGKNKGRMYKLK